MMDGISLISTLDVTTRGLLSASLRSKTETASEAIHLPSGHLIHGLVLLLKTLKQCCSICLAAVTLPPINKETRYCAVRGVDLILATLSCV
jgi:hypothetical protein